MVANPVAVFGYPASTNWPRATAAVAAVWAESGLSHVGSQTRGGFLNLLC
jgi:hypothetical protein